MSEQKPRRWLQSAIAEAAKCDTAMPWQRGDMRAAAKAQRREPAPPRTTRHLPLRRSA